MGTILRQESEQQVFANGYELVDGVAMNEAHGDRFHVPHNVLKKLVQWLGTL
ncbi:MAG: hypothetical protein RIK87_01920 [Fuerstiella sp.]